MNKLYTILALTGIILLNGCMSYMVYKGSEQRVATKKAWASGDKAAITAMQLGNDGVGIGIDVSNWEALMNAPFSQLGAAILDAGILYGGYRGVDALNSHSVHSSPSTLTVESNGGHVTIINNGNNVTITYPAMSEEKTDTIAP